MLQESSLPPAEPVGVLTALSQLEIALCNESLSFRALMHGRNVIKKKKQQNFYKVNSCYNQSNNFLL